MEKTREQELLARIAELEAAQTAGLRIMPSVKGCVSVSGINGKFPVSLYPAQWRRLFAIQNRIEAFIADPKNQQYLTWGKDEGPKTIHPDALARAEKYAKKNTDESAPKPLDAILVKKGR